MVSQTDYRTMLAEQMLESPTKSGPYGQTLLGHTHSRIVAVGGRGVLAYHTHNSRFSRDGYPDWVIHVPGGAILRTQGVRPDDLDLHGVVHSARSGSVRRLQPAPAAVAVRFRGLVNELLRSRRRARALPLRQSRC